MRLARLAPSAIALLAVVLGACEVRTDVAVDVARDGSGEVRVAVGLDDESLEIVGDLAAQLRVDDLRAAGWEIVGPLAEGDGLTWVRASKPFGRAEDAAATLAEISGPQGPFRDFSVARRDGFVADDYEFVGTVDLTGGLEGFSDDELRQLLGGDTFGERLAELSAQIGDRLEDVFPVRVAVRLPGDESANAPTVTSDAAVWTPHLGERLELAATSRVYDSATIAWLSLATVAGLGLVALGVVSLVRRRRRSSTV